MKPIRIALVGNPNCGKTCIFNGLTGARQHVGNYPGVTVESKSGRFILDGRDVELVDLPGIYTLSSHSPEEKVVFQELTGKATRPDLILNIVDSSVPERSFYLTSQLASLGIPTLLVLNMSDEADRKRIHFNHKQMEEFFGVHVVRTVGRTAEGVRPLIEALSVFLHYGMENPPVALGYGEDVEREIVALLPRVQKAMPEDLAPESARFLSIKLLERDTTVEALPGVKELVPAAKEALSRIGDTGDGTSLAVKRFAMLSEFAAKAIVQGEKENRERGFKVDKVLTSPWLGIPIFLAIIYLTFWFTFTLGDPFMGWIEDGFGWLSDLVKNVWPDGKAEYFRDLVTDGIIGGVGGVLVFLPNIVLLFIAIVLLEDSGYMARAAFVMDGLMRKFGLHGRSFVPLVMGFGCNVPAIMATRTIESQRDRRTTIMVLPAMSCGARLPIYALVIPVFFTGTTRSVVMFGLYVLGVVVALIAARIMKSTLFKGDDETFLMELPPYRMPTFRSLVMHVWDRAKMYLHKAGTIILFTSIVLYFFNTLPARTEFSKDYDKEIAAVQEAIDGLEAAVPADNQAVAAVKDAIAADEEADPSEILDAAIAEATAKGDEGAATVGYLNILKDIQEKEGEIETLENERSAETMDYTISGRIGHALQPLFAPIGFDDKLVTASLAGLAAKEVFVSQLGILYAEGEADEENEGLRAQLRAHYTPLQGVSILIFSLLSIPCFATLAVIKRELNSWKWLAYECIGLFAVAYLLTMVVYQVGRAMGWGC